MATYEEKTAFPRVLAEPDPSIVGTVEDRRPAIVVDMDGTLARLGSRGPFDYARCGEDAANELVVGVVNHFARTGHAVLVVTGRPAKVHGQTTNWLSVHGVQYDLIYMRLDNDYRKDSVFKAETYRSDIEPAFDVKLALDDRDSSVFTWRLLGIPTWQVAPGDF